VYTLSAVNEMPTRRVLAVTFDCWGTLITDRDFETAMATRVAALADACEIDEQAASELLDRAWREHHHAWLNGTQYGSEGIARFCSLELALADPKACDRLQEAFEEAGRLGVQEALPGAVDTLRTLRGAGMRTALVCDAGFTPGRIVRDFLNDQGLLEHLEFCAFSNEVGEPKPGAKIFRAALDALGVEASEAVHVGDLLRTDVFGARSLGMRTVRITAVGDDAAGGFSWNPDAPFGGNVVNEGGRTASPYDDADEVVRSHTELLDALRRLGAAL
jgi:HAD superfamily hydrolase (TIGR01549 family)